MLFTSPEDMVVGQSVTLQHRKEITSAAAARRLKTVNKLVSSSMDYEPAKVNQYYIAIIQWNLRIMDMLGQAFIVRLSSLQRLKLYNIYTGIARIMDTLGQAFIEKLSSVQR